METEIEISHYVIVATTDNPANVGHAVNVSTFLSSRFYLTAEEVEGGIPALKKELVEMGGYSQSIVDDLIFQPRPVTAP